MVIDLYFNLYVSYFNYDVNILYFYEYFDFGIKMFYIDI